MILWILFYLAILSTLMVLSHKIPEKSRGGYIFLGISFVGILSFGISYRATGHAFLVNLLGCYSFFILYYSTWVGWFGAPFFILASRNIEDQRSGKSVLFLAYVVALYSGGTIISFPFLVSDHRNLKDQVSESICLQSTSYSCSAAAMVNLLQFYKIPGTEKEMAELAQTRRAFGTYSAGVFYGLTQKTLGQYRVKFQNGKIADLKRLDRPCIVSIRWSPLINHSIVVEKFSQNQFQVIDSLPGKKQQMSASEMETKWLRDMIYLEPLNE